MKQALLVLAAMALALASSVRAEVPLPIYPDCGTPQSL